MKEGKKMKQPLGDGEPVDKDRNKGKKGEKKQVGKAKLKKNLKKLKSKTRSVKKIISRRSGRKEKVAEEMSLLKKRGESLQKDYEKNLHKLEEASLRLKLINDELRIIKDQLSQRK
ncbi:MAG: hypothetical protein U0T82_07075 [Bacteroidales bacterium]